MSELKSVYLVTNKVSGKNLNIQLQGFRITSIYPRLEFAKKHFEYILEDRRRGEYKITDIDLTKLPKETPFKHRFYNIILKQVSILNNITKSVEIFSLEKHDISIRTSKAILQKIKNYLVGTAKF